MQCPFKASVEVSSGLYRYLASLGCVGKSGAVKLVASQIHRFLCLSKFSRFITLLHHQEKPSSASRVRRYLPNKEALRELHLDLTSIFTRPAYLPLTSFCILYTYLRKLLPLAFISFLSLRSPPYTPIRHRQDGMSTELSAQPRAR